MKKTGRDKTGGKKSGGKYWSRYVTVLIGMIMKKVYFRKLTKKLYKITTAEDLPYSVRKVSGVTRSENKGVP